MTFIKYPGIDPRIIKDQYKPETSKEVGFSFDIDEQEGQKWIVVYVHYLQLDERDLIESRTIAAYLDKPELEHFIEELKLLKKRFINP